MDVLPRARPEEGPPGGPRSRTAGSGGSWWRTLTGRLVVTAVALVAVVCVLIAAATTLAMRTSLLDRLDEEVHELADRGFGPGGNGQFAPGTLVVAVPDGQAPYGGIAGFRLREQEALDEEALAEVAAVPADGEPRTVGVPGQGGYRLMGIEATDGTLVVGLPTEDIDATLRNLVLTELLLTLLGVGAAAAVGTLVVRRQLRPLREVAATAQAVSELPLASGEIEVSARVPDRLTDERNEVGRVGVALNNLLDHVEQALEARHRSEQQVRQFVADASHELRTPLTTIRGYTELAQARPDDRAAGTTALEKVSEESRRMTQMVEDLLLLARLDQGRPLERQPVDLTRLLLETVEDARVVAPRHHWRLVLGSGLSPEGEVVVPGDVERLHQVVSNLLTNARRYTPDGTTVTVAVRPDGFTVHDDGPGFPPDLVPRAFERFTRGDAARGREGGTGLGLSIVQAIVASHGGRVSLASRPGDTTVTVSLPRT